MKTHRSVFVIAILMLLSIASSLVYGNSNNGETYVAIILSKGVVDEDLSEMAKIFESKGIPIGVVVNRVEFYSNFSNSVEFLAGSFGNAILSLLYDMGLNEHVKKHIELSINEVKKCGEIPAGFYAPLLSYNDGVLDILEKLGLKYAIAPETKELSSGHVYLVDGFNVTLIPASKNTENLLYDVDLDQLKSVLTQQILFEVTKGEVLVININLDKLFDKYQQNAYMALNEVAEAIINVSNYEHIHIVKPSTILERVSPKEITLGTFKAYDLATINITEILSESDVPTRNTSFPEVIEEGSLYDFIKTRDQKVFFDLLKTLKEDPVTEEVLLAEDYQLIETIQNTYHKIKDYLLGHYQKINRTPPGMLQSMSRFSGEPPEYKVPGALGDAPNHVILDGDTSEWKSYYLIKINDGAELMISYDLEKNIYIGLRNLSNATIILGHTSLSFENLLEMPWLFNTPYGIIDPMFPGIYEVDIYEDHADFTSVYAPQVSYEIPVYSSNNSIELMLPNYLIQDLIPPENFVRKVYVYLISESVKLETPSYFKLVNITIPPLPEYFMDDPPGDSFGPGTYLSNVKASSLDIILFSIYPTMDYVFFNVTFLEPPEGSIMPVVDIYIDVLRNYGSREALDGPNVIFTSTFDWEVCIRAAPDPKVARVFLWSSSNILIREDVYVEVKDSSLIIVVPSKYIPQKYDSMKIVVLVGIYDPDSPDSWRVIDQSLGAPEDVYAARIQPNVVDLLAPTINEQKTMLNSYDISEKIKSKVYGYLITSYPKITPTSTPTSTPTETPGEGEEIFEPMVLIIGGAAIVIALILVLRKLKGE